MEAIAVILLVIFVPLILIVVGLSLFNKGAETISSVGREWKDQNAEHFANRFFSKHGVNAPWELYISEFQKKFGRKPAFREIKVPVTRTDLSRLMEICQQQGIA